MLKNYFIWGVMLIAISISTIGCSNGGLDPIGGLPVIDPVNEDGGDDLMRFLQVPIGWGVELRACQYNSYGPIQRFWANKCDYFTVDEKLMWVSDKHGDPLPTHDPGFWYHQAGLSSHLYYDRAWVGQYDYLFNRMQGIAQKEGLNGQTSEDHFFSSVKCYPYLGDRGGDENEKVLPPWHEQSRSQYYYIYQFALRDDQGTDKTYCIGYYNGPSVTPAVDVAYNDSIDALSLLWYDVSQTDMNVYFLVEDGTHPDGLIKWSYQSPTNKISDDADDALAIDTVDDLFFLLEKNNGNTKMWVKVFSISEDGDGWDLTAIGSDTLDQWLGITNGFDYSCYIQPEIAVRNTGNDKYLVSFIAGKPYTEWDDTAYIYLYEYDYSKSAGNRWTFKAFRRLSSDGGTVAFESNTQLSSSHAKNYMDHYTYVGNSQHVEPGFEDDKWILGPYGNMHVDKIQYLNEEEKIVLTDNHSSNIGFWVHEKGTTSNPVFYDEFVDEVSDPNRVYGVQNLCGLQTVKWFEYPDYYDHVFAAIDTNVEGYRLWGLRFDPNASNELTVAGRSDLISGDKTPRDLTEFMSPSFRGNNRYIITLSCNLLNGKYYLNFYTFDNDQSYVYNIDMEASLELTNPLSTGFTPIAIDAFPAYSSDVIFVLGKYSYYGRYYYKLKVYGVTYTNNVATGLEDGQIDLYMDPDSYRFKYSSDFASQIEVIDNDDEVRVGFIAGSTSTSGLRPAAWIYDIEDDATPVWSYEAYHNLSDDPYKFGGGFGWNNSVSNFTTNLEYDYITYFDIN